MTMSITPETKIGPLLDEYPGLEERLIERVPAFVKLRNPILRRTVAKVATVEHAARIAGLPIREFVQWLRAATGQAEGPDPHEALPAPAEAPAPDWFDPSRIRGSVDVEPVLAAGGHPLGEVRKALDRLDPGSILELRSPFPPLPLVDALRKAGHEAWIRSTGEGRFVTYLERRAPAK